MDKESKSPAWQRAEGKNDEGGLNAKGRASYNKATGGNLKAPVTESNPKGDRAKRQNSFCSRMCGMKKHETGSKTKKDPDSRINKSLRKWNCKCGSAVEFGAKLAAETTPAAATPAAPKPSLSSTSIGNSTNPPPGSYTGKVRLPITNSTQSYMAHAANLAAGNPVQPAQKGEPQTILAPPTGKANNPITRMMDYYDPPNDMARAGRQVTTIADEFDRNSGELGRRFVADMATPGKYVPNPAQSGGYIPSSMVKTQSARDFGAKFATVILADAPEHKDDSGVDVNPVAAGTPEGKEKLTKKPVPEKAEDVVNKAAEFGAKLAGSLVNFVERKPKDLTKGTLNPVAAGEEHEEVQEETTNEPASPSPMEFGAKAAFDLANLTGNVPPAPAPELPPSLLNAMPPQLSRYATENGPVIPGEPLPPTRPDTPPLNIVPKAPGIFERAYQSYMDGSKRIGEYWGPKLDTASRALSSLATSPEAWTSAPENGMGPAPKAEPAVAKSEPAKPEPIPNAPTAEAGPKAEGSYLPYAVGGGLGAAGLAALVYYLMNQQKGKKRREEEELAV